LKTCVKRGDRFHNIFNINWNAELSEREEIVENELPDHGDLISDPLTVVSEGSDEESASKGKKATCWTFT
jgi:hypothetical protein